MAHHMRLCPNVGMGPTHRTHTGYTMNSATTVTGCQYIGTDYPRLQPTCCSPALKNRAYCTEHLWLVYKEGTAVHRKKDTRIASDVRLWESLFNEAVEELIAEGELDL